MDSCGNIEDTENLEFLDESLFLPQMLKWSLSPKIFLTDPLNMDVSPTLKLPLEIFQIIFEYVDDLRTFCTLIEIYPNLLKPKLERRFDIIVSHLLIKEFRRYTDTILQIESDLPP